jgi:hypothetical protein
MYAQLVAEGVVKQVQKWRANQSVIKPAAVNSTPQALDRANPRRLDLERCRLLNYNPSAYFGRRVAWDPPARFNVAQFMIRCKLPELAPYTEVLRLTTDGKVQIRSASKLWFRLFGVGYNFAKPNPLTFTDIVRPEQIKNTQLIQFLELLT